MALISRGTCNFSNKTVLAAQAGALATVIYNNVDGVVAGGLGEGDFIPTIGISRADGLAILANLPEIANVTVIFNQVTT